MAIADSEPPGPLRSAEPIVPARHIGRWIWSAVVLLVLVALVDSMVTNSRFGWGTVGQYFTSDFILAGVGRTILLTVATMVIGVLLGTFVAVTRMSANPLLAGAGWFYVWIFRSTPLLVQLLFWYNLSALYPSLSLGVPFGPTLLSGNANDIITPLTAALLGLGLQSAAYCAEIIRGGILSVDPGQTEAALALGMTRLLVLRRILLPQAMRVIVPPLGNETVSTLKATSLVSVISLADLLYSAQIVYSRTFQTIPLLLVAVLWYLIMTSILSVGQYYVEAYFGRGGARESVRMSLRQVLNGFLVLRPWASAHER
jgi:polar amino acid transport system permease protein